MRCPKISIIIPTYNSEKYIYELFASIKNVKNSEIIVVDDGSKDKTISEIRTWGARMFEENDFYVIINQHKGPSVSRNIGIKEARGKYIIFIDSDDLVRSDVLNYICSLDINYDIISFSKSPERKIINTDTEKFGLINEVIMHSGIPSYTAAPWGKMYSRKFILDNKILFSPLVHRGEDLLFNVEAIQNAKSILLEQYDFYLVRLTSNSITRGTDMKVLMNSKAFVKLGMKVLDSIETTMPLINNKKIIDLKRNLQKKSFSTDISYALRHNYTVDQIDDYEKWFKRNCADVSIEDIQEENVIKKIEFFLLRHNKRNLIKCYIWLINAFQQLRKFVKWC